MECERCAEVVWGLSAVSELEVVAEEWAEHRVGAVFDNFVRALYGIFSAEISDALLGDYDVDGVFGVVDMRNHRDDVADESALCDGGAAEDGDVSVAGEVA